MKGIVTMSHGRTERKANGEPDAMDSEEDRRQLNGGR